MKWLLATLLVLVPTLGWAADGDSCDSTQWDGTFGGSQVRGAQCMILCDDEDSNTVCGDTGFFDMSRNMFDYIAFKIWDNSTGCGAGTVTFTSVTTEGGDDSQVGSGTLNAATPGSHMLVMPGWPRDENDLMYQNLIVETSGMTCTGSIDVMMIGYEVGR